MTTLLTSDGRLTRSGDPAQYFRGGTRGLSVGSMPFSQWSSSGRIARVGGGSLSYDQLWEQQPWVKACVDMLSNQIASIPLKVYQRNSQNDRERVDPSHPLATLLSKPWPRAGAVHLKQKIAFPWLVHGNSVIAKDRPTKGAPPNRLKALDWRTLDPQVVEGDLIAWKVNLDSGGTTYIVPDDTMHFYWESTVGYMGLSPLKQLAATLKLEDAAQRYGIATFENGGVPGAVYTLPPEVKKTDELVADLTRSFEARHATPENARRMVVVGGGGQVQSYAKDADESELIAQRQLNREEVAAAYNTPPPMIGILDKATFSNITEQHRMLYMTVLRPRFTLIEETTEAQLIGPESEWSELFVEFDLSEVLKASPKERAEAFKTFLESGAYTINDLRRAENKPTFDHPLADQPLIPANNLQPLDSFGQNAAAPQAASLLADHIGRARDRVFARNGAGHGDPLNAERFKRELTEDLEPKLGEMAEPFADVWTAALDLGVKDAKGDREQLERFFQPFTG